jgi:site-specific recombinase XerD
MPIVGLVTRQASIVDLGPMIRSCLQSEDARNLSVRSIDELTRNLELLQDYCRQQNITGIDDLTPALLKDFVIASGKNSPTTTKLLVWTVRKFGDHLALLGELPTNPAAALKHPKISRRARLPEYLSPTELHDLLETAVVLRDLREVTVICLLATAGLRPFEVASLRRCDIDTGQQCVYLRVKGNWRKRTPLSAVMAETLSDYLAAYPDRNDILFRNDWGNPIDKRWVLRLVRAVAKQAGIRRRITPRILRHTFATYLADRHGKQITRALLGHGGDHSTDVYMHLIPSKFRPLMNKHPYWTTIGRGRP